MATQIKTPLMNYSEYLRRQGISEFEAQQMGIMLLSSAEASNILGMKVRYEGILLPYPGTNYARVRMLGGSIRYLSPVGSGVPPTYLPASRPWADIFADAKQDIVITEGEFKSWTTCRAGANCLGIAGVDVQSTLLSADIEWHERRVFICFDKDAGFRAGEYKPEVGRALGRLTTELVRRGAQVWTMCIPGDEGEKLGLDDYLNGGGTLDILYASATKPEEYYEHLAHLLDTCIYVVGTDHTHVYNVENGSRKSIADFHQAHVDKVRMVPKADGSGVRAEYASKVMVTHKYRSTAQNYTLDPTSAKGLVGDMINLWEPYPSWSTVDEKIVGEWQKFMEGLFGEHWSWVGSWVGHMLNRPEEKTHQAVMVVTAVKGIGKGVFSEVVGLLVGEEHYNECQPKNLLKQFNKNMMGRTWVAVHELDVTFSVREGEINDLITSASTEIEAKGVDSMSLPNLRRWYFTTNASSPMRLSKGQRRILVVCPPRTHEDTRGEWGHWVGGVVARYKENPSALGAIRQWFDTCLEQWEEQNGRWNPALPVPETEAGEEVAEASMTSAQVLSHTAVDWIRENGGIGAISPDHRKLKTRVFGDVGAIVRATGGSVFKMQIRVDGVNKEFTIWDFTGLPKVKNANGGYSIEPGHRPEPDVIKALAASLWSVVRNLAEQQMGHEPLKGA